MSDPFADLVPDNEAPPPSRAVPTEFDDLVPNEPLTKSEKVGRSLKGVLFPTAGDYLAAGSGIVDSAASIGSELVGEVASGIAGIGGMAQGAVTNTLDSALEGMGADDDTWQPDGPMETGAKWQENVSDAIGWEPFSKQGDDVSEMAGQGMEKTVQGAKHVGAGYTGLANLAMGDPDLAAMSVRDFLATPQALAEGVFEATESPTLAAVTAILPDLATIALPGAKTTKLGKVKPSYDPHAPADMPPGYGGVGDTAETARPMPDMDAPTGRPVPESGYEASPDLNQNDFDEIQAALQSKDKHRMFELMEANPKYVQAFEALGIEFTPGMVSENAALRNVQSSMKSVPGSDLPVFDGAARQKLQTAADDLVNREGNTNRMALDENVTAEYTRIRDGFVELEAGLWEKFRAKVPRGSTMDLEASANAVHQRVVDAGRNGSVEDGLKAVSKHDQELFRLTHERVPHETTRVHEGKEITETEMVWEYTEPKYAAIDKYRKELGKASGKEGDFRGGEQAEIDHLYGQMADAQGRVAQGNGYGAEWKEMNATTVARKNLEASQSRSTRAAAGLIGRISGASSNLRKGIAKPLRELMEDTPQAQRAAVASAVLEDMFYPAAVKTGEIKPNFVASYKALKRNPEAMDLIFEHLEDATKADFIIVGDAAEGFFRSLLKDNNSNTAAANEVIKQLSEGKTVMRMMGIARSGAQRVPLAGATIAREGEAGIAAAMKGRARKAAEFLASRELRDAVVAYSKGGVEEAKRILNGSRAYNQWFEYLSAAEKKQMAAAGGVIGWLTSEEE